MRTQAQIEANSPQHMMTLTCGTKVEGRALPLVEALAWSELADAAHEAYAAAAQKDDRNEQANAMLAIVDIVADYPWIKPCPEKIKESASSGQIINAFYELRNTNDPFVVAAKREELSQKEQMENVKEIMSMLPESERMKMINAGLEKARAL